MPSRQRQHQAVLKLTEEQALLAANLAAALSQPGGPRPVQVAERCGVSEQAVSNWKRTGKISKENLAVVSEMTGWSVRRLLTGADDLPHAPPIPPRDFADRREVSDSEWDTLQAVKVLFTPEQMADLRKQAAAAAERVRAVMPHLVGIHKGEEP